MNMKKHEITVLGEKFIVSSGKNGNKVSEKFPAFVLLPSLKNDFELQCIGDFSFSALGAVRAAAAYIYDVLGYPRCELGVRAFDKSYIINKTQHGIGVAIDKCKTKFTKINCESSGVDLSLVLVRAEIDAAFLKTENSEHFDLSLASSIALRDKNAGCDLIAGFEFKNGEALLFQPSSFHFPVELALTLFRYLSSSHPLARDNLEVQIRDKGSIRFRKDNSGFVEFFTGADFV